MKKVLLIILGLIFIALIVAGCMWYQGYFERVEDSRNTKPDEVKPTLEVIEDEEFQPPMIEPKPDFEDGFVESDPNSKSIDEAVKYPNDLTEEELKDIYPLPGGKMIGEEPNKLFRMEDFSIFPRNQEDYVYMLYKQELPLYNLKLDAGWYARFKGHERFDSVIINKLNPGRFSFDFDKYDPSMVKEEHKDINCIYDEATRPRTVFDWFLYHQYHYAHDLDKYTPEMEWDYINLEIPGLSDYDNTVRQSQVLPAPPGRPVPLEEL